MLWEVTAIVFIAGCVGGSVTGLVAHESSRSSNDNGTQSKDKEWRKYSIAYKNPGCDTVFAGLAGHVLLGGVAALVYWGLYGPFSGFAIVGATPHGAGLMEPFLTVGQLACSILLRYWRPCFFAGRIAATL